MSVLMGKKNGIKLFVGGLAPETTADTLREYFEMFSVVFHAKVALAKKLRIPKGFGYVTVPDMKSVNTIMSSKHLIDGRSTDIEIANSKNTKTASPTLQPNRSTIKKAPEATIESLLCQPKSIQGKPTFSSFPTNSTQKCFRPIKNITNYNGGFFNRFLNTSHQHQLDDHISRSFRLVGLTNKFNPGVGIPPPLTYTTPVRVATQRAATTPGHSSDAGLTRRPPSRLAAMLAVASRLYDHSEANLRINQAPETARLF